jgi:5-methylcytosine-specific restriction endonuclease McrA
MTPCFMIRTRSIYSNQQQRSRKFGCSLPYTLAEFRKHITPGVNDPRCRYCGYLMISETLFTVDHAIPLSRGGSWELANLVVCCAACNAAKGPLTSQEFAQLLFLLGRWPPEAQTDTLRRLKIGGNPMAARLMHGGK